MYVTEGWDKVSVWKGSCSVHGFAKFQGEEVAVKKAELLKTVNLAICGRFRNVRYVEMDLCDFWF